MSDTKSRPYSASHRQYIGAGSSSYRRGGGENMDSSKLSSLKALPRAGSAVARKRQQLQVQQYQGVEGNGVPNQDNQKLEELWRKKQKISAIQETAVWQAFGQYLAKVLKSGKGVSVGKLGNFTFTATGVDLAGTTNPAIRDRQERLPVFLVAKDFCRGMSLRSAIAGGAGTGQLRPFDQQGTSGIIPLIKINYFEVATLVGAHTACKDTCRSICEWKFKTISDRARKGEVIHEPIPHLGKLQIKGGIVGVTFDPSLIEGSRGQTAKTFADTLFQTNNNLMNNKLHEPDPHKASKPPLPDTVKSAMKRLDMNKIQDRKGIRESMVQNAARIRQASGKENDSRAAGPYLVPSVSASFAAGSMEKMLQGMNDSSLRKLVVNDFGRSSASRRPVSSYQSESRKLGPSKSMASMSCTGSRASFSSAMSRVPELAPFQLMNLANNIYLLRSQICDLVQTRKFETTTLRDVLSSSKIQQIIAKAGNRIEIGHLKALLKELGFNWNGPACSLTQLLSGLKVYLNPHLSQNNGSINSQVKPTSARTVRVGEKVQFPVGQKTLLGLKTSAGNHSVGDMIKELFYASRKPLYEIYREVVTKDRLDSELFYILVSKYSNNVINKADAVQAFLQVCKSVAKPTQPGKDYLTWQEFENNFKMIIPDPEKFQSEAKVILEVKGWLTSRHYTSEEAFEKLLRSVDRISQRSLRRYEFHKAIVANDIKLTAPEIDYLFDVITGFKNLPSTLLGQNQWLAKIVDETGNPLQVLRSIVQKQNINREKVLKVLDLKLWDPPLNFSSFMEYIRKLEPSLSEQLGQELFKRLQNRDAKVEIQTLVANICGSESETVDFKVTMFKTLYSEVYQKNNQKRFLNMCEAEDKKNDGKVEPSKLEAILKQITTGSDVSPEAIHNFVGQVRKDPDTGKICYLSFMDSVAGLGNKNHNPFKQVLTKLEFFVETNKLKAIDLLKRIGANSSDGVSVEEFAKFLKQKVDQSQTKEQMERIARLMDVDKDGYIDEMDVATCLKNIDSSEFVKEDGKALEKPQFQTKQKFYTPTYQPGDLPDARVVSICKTIRDAMEGKGYTTQLMFSAFDSDQDGMLTLSEFKRGIATLVTLSGSILDKMFGIMDRNKIGMVDFGQFRQVIEAKAPSQMPRATVEDGFQWQQDVMRAIRRFAKTQQLSALDAFRYFDQDFDGLISKSDMKISLSSYLEIPAHKIDDHRLDRLFRLLSFYKSETLQPSDFDRLLVDQNPYLTACQGQPKAKFKQTMGGALTSTSTHDWMFACIQQIGLVVSRSYPSIQESFQSASNNTDRVNYQQFKTFVEKHDALSGFNVTASLLRQLFASLDPHKKTFLSKKDWITSFEAFNQNDSLLLEFKNYLQCQFSDVNSAFGFIQTFGTSSLITLETFTSAAKSLIPSRRYTHDQLKYMYNSFLREPTDFQTGFNGNHFGYQFEHIQFKGKQTLVTQLNPNNKGGYVTTVQSATNANWERDIIAKLRSIINSSGKNIWQIFSEFDSDGSGTITTKEFRNAIRKMQLGLTSKEIDKVLQRIDLNGDGVVNFDEFSAVLGANQGFDKKMMQRANDKLAQLKERMQMYLISHQDAYRKFDQSKVGKMTYSDFDQLVSEMSKAAKQQIPAYTVIKDLFDAVDIKKDGHIDQKEWNQTFNTLQAGGPASTMKAGALASWENSHESNQIGELMSKNRKLLIQNFKRLSTHTSDNGVPKYVTFAQAKEALQDVLYTEFGKKSVSDDKLKQVLSVGQIPDHTRTQQEPIYAFMKIMDLFKERYKPVV